MGILEVKSPSKTFVRDVTGRTGIMEGDKSVYGTDKAGKKFFEKRLDV
jgi:hypothetical protein